MAEPDSSGEDATPNRLAWAAVPGRIGNAQVAILTILREEHAAVVAAGSISNPIPNTPYTYRNRLGPDLYDIIAARSLDRGNVPISNLVTTVVERFRPEFIILSGIAGGVAGRDGVQLGDVVVADHVDWYEMRKLVGGESKIRKQAVDHPSAYLRDAIVSTVERNGTWTGRVTTTRPKKGTLKMIEGNIIAGDKVLGDHKNQYQREVLDEFDKALAVDMESYGLGRAVYECRGTRRYNLGYMIVRGISDLVADENNNATRTKWRDYAAATAAAFAIDAADAIIATGV
jgi:nucleoside phosphorylase